MCRLIKARDGNVVGDEQIGEPQSSAVDRAAVQDLGLPDTSSEETGSSADEQLGCSARGGNADALLLPARKIRSQSAGGMDGMAGQPSSRTHLGRPFAGVPMA